MNASTKHIVYVTLLLVAFMFGPANAEAAKHYVRAGASGSANGNDWTNAFTMLPPTLTRGDTYYIADGSYVGRIFDDAVSGTLVTIIQKATVADHGTSTGWLDSYGDGQAVFTSRFEFLSSYWIVDGVTGGGPQNLWAGNFGFRINEARDDMALIKLGNPSYFPGGLKAVSNITLRHMELYGKGSVSTHGGSNSNDGVETYNASDVTISYFLMSGIGRCPFFLSGANFIAEYGWVKSYFASIPVHSEVMAIWSFAGTVGDTTLRYSLITDIQGTGGVMWNNQANTSAQLYVYGNIFYKSPGAVWAVSNGLIGGWTGASGDEFHNARVYNNTFINVDQQSLSTFPNIFSGNIAYNNFWYNSHPPDFAKFATHDYNHFINSGGTQLEPSGTSVSASNPFVDFTDYNFYLSAATASGQSLPSPFNVDMFGTVRGSDGIWDRGAIEFTSSQTPTPIPSSTPTPSSSPTPTPSSTPPSVSLISPTSGFTIGGSVSLEATASSNTGVTGVQFLLDGVPLGGEVTSSPYRMVWDTALTTDGPHTLTATARDATGNQTTSSGAIITIANATASTQTPDPTPQPTPTPTTLDSITPSSTPSSVHRPLYRGTKGDDVKTLQTLLIQKGHLPPTNDTGFFGPLTRAAVQKYQCSEGIVCSGTESSTGYGVAGPKTLARLNGSTLTTSSSSSTLTPAQADAILSVLLSFNADASVIASVRRVLGR